MPLKEFPGMPHAVTTYVSECHVSVCACALGLVTVCIRVCVCVSLGVYIHDM